MQTPKLAAIYFLAVFAAGFALGLVRSLWLVPRFGDLTAETLEARIMRSWWRFSAHYPRW